MLLQYRYGIIKFALSKIWVIREVSEEIDFVILLLV